METKTRMAFDYDSEKALLVKKSSMLEGDIEQDFERIKEYVEEYGKTALIIGGSLLGTYLLLRLLTSSSSDDEDTIKVLPNNYVHQAAGQPVIQVVKEEPDSPIVSQIKASIALFLISIAKQKLQEFIENYGKEKKSE